MVEEEEEEGVVLEGGGPRPMGMWKVVVGTVVFSEEERERMIELFLQALVVRAGDEEQKRLNARIDQIV